jgi:hypothetical protein
LRIDPAMARKGKWTAFEDERLKNKKMSNNGGKN